MTRWREALAHRWLVPALGAVVAAQLATSVWLLHGSYFFAEDFGQLTDYADRPLGPDLLRNSVFGHFVPGFMLIQHVVGSWFGADWLATSVITCVVQVLGTVAFARLLLALCGRTWWLPWAVTSWALGVVVLNTVPWWAATLSPQLAVVTSISTWGCFMRYAASRSPRHLASLAVMFALSLSFLEKSVVGCAYLALFVLVVGLERRAESGWGDRLREALRLWPAWLVLAVLSALDLAVFLTGGYLEEAGDAAGVGDTAWYVVRSFPQGLLPSLFGAIHPVSDLPGPSALTPWVATVAALALVVWTASRARLAARAWLWFLACAVLSQVLVARGRLSLLGADLLVTNLRYQVDAAYLFVLALAVALPAAVATVRRPARSSLRAAALVVPLLVAPLWLQSVRAIDHENPGRVSRDYFAALREQDPEGPMLDLPVPEWIVPPAMYPWNMAHTIYPAIAPGVRVTDDPDGAWWIRPDGSLGPVALADLTPPTAGPQCVQAGPAVPILQPDTSVFDQYPAPVLVALRYTATSRDGGDLAAQLYVGRNRVHKNIRRTGSAFALDAQGSLATVVAQTHWNTVYLDVKTPGEVCVSDVRLVRPD